MSISLGTCMWVCLAYLKSWVRFTGLYKPGLMAPVCNSSIKEIDTGGAGGQDCLWFHCEFKASLGSKRCRVNDNFKTEAKSRLQPFTVGPWVTAVVAEDWSQPWRTSLKYKTWMIKRTKEHRGQEGTSLDIKGKIMNELTKDLKTSRSSKHTDILRPQDCLTLRSDFTISHITRVIFCAINSCLLSFLRLAWPIFHLIFKLKPCFPLYPEPWFLWLPFLWHVAQHTFVPSLGYHLLCSFLWGDVDRHLLNLDRT